MFKTEIEAGVEFLNVNCPGWLSKINLDRLNISDIKDCILGQIFGTDLEYGFYRAKKIYNLSDEYTEKLGFYVNDEEFEDVWENLQKEWINKIKELRNNVSL